MNPESIFDSLPEGLRFALMEWITDPPVHNQAKPGFLELRLLAEMTYGPERELFTDNSLFAAYVKEQLDEWLPQQEAIWNEAVETQQALLDGWPPPSAANAGPDPQFPEWMFEPWASSLWHPWAEDLAVVVACAQEWMRNHESEKSTAA